MPDVIASPASPVESFKANKGAIPPSAEFLNVFKKATADPAATPAAPVAVETPKADPVIKQEEPSPKVLEKEIPKAPEPAKQTNIFEKVVKQEEKKESPQPKVEVASDADLTPAEIEATKEKFKTGESRQAFERVLAIKDKIAKREALAQTEIGMLKAKLIEAESKAKTPVTPPDYDEVKKQNEQLQTLIERVNVEASPKFQAKYDVPLKATMDNMHKQLTGTTVDPNQFLAYVLSPETPERENKIQEMLAEVDPVKAARIGTNLEKFEQVRAERSSELNNAKAVYAQQQEAQKQQFTLQKETEGKVLDEVFSEVRKETPLLQRNEDPTWNETVETVEKKAKQLWSTGSNPKELAQTTIFGVMYPYVKSAAEHWYSETLKLQDELKAIHSARASVSSTTPAPAESPKESAMSAFKKAAFGNV